MDLNRVPGKDVWKLYTSFNAYNALASRRDHWFRLVQFASKLVLTTAAERGCSAEEWFKRLKGLESAVGDARKLFRIVSSADFFQKALETWNRSGQDEILRVTQTLGFLGRVLWLFHDHAMWLTRAGVIKGDMAQLTRKSAWCWLLALAFLIARDLRHQALLDEKLRKAKEGGVGDPADTRRIQHEMRVARVELWKNVLDLLIPLSMLGRVGPKLGSFAGVITTLISIRQEWRKLNT